MEFYSLQEFFTHTKGIVYLLMGGILVSVLLWWQFLMGGKEDSPAEDHHSGHGHKGH